MGQQENDDHPIDDVDGEESVIAVAAEGEGEMEIEDAEEPKEKKKKGKTSKYYGVSKIGKRFRAMFGGKYIGMADKEIDAARMVNEACKTNGVEPKNKVPASKKSKSKKKARLAKKVTKKANKKRTNKKASKTKKAKKIVKRKK